MYTRYNYLGFKVISMTLSFSLIPLLVLGATIYYQFHDAFQAKMLESLKMVLIDKKGDVESYFAERISQLNTIAETHSFQTLSDQNFLTKTFNVMQAKSKSFIDLGVIDSDGNHVAYVGQYQEQLKSVNYANEDWFRAVQSAGIYVSDAFLGFRKIPHFIIAVARVENNNVWILRATINSVLLDEIISFAQVGKSGDAFLINRQNLLQTPGRFAGKTLERPNCPDFSFSRGITGELMNFKGQKSLFGTISLSTPPWVLVIKENPHEEMAPFFRAEHVGGMILGCGLILVVLGTVFTTRMMIRRLIEAEKEKLINEDLMMQSSKMAALGKMAAGIAHEINNPLQIIGDQAGWMKDLLEDEQTKKDENFEEFEECIKKIERQVSRSREITHRLLRFGRRMETTQEMVDINHLLTETMAFLENEANFRDIKIQTEFDKSLPRISTDPNQLQQVFLNIIDNAIDSVGESGQIGINTNVDPKNPKEILVRISDNGPGIPKALLPKIFDPFFTTKPPNEGTGLGLSISYGIVEKLGGHITVESEEGKGSTFSIRIPRG